MTNPLGAIVISVVSSAISIGVQKMVKTQPFIVFSNRYGKKNIGGMRFFRRLKWRTAHDGASRVAQCIKDDGAIPDLIVGVGRGGAIFGALLSYKLAKPDSRGKKHNIPMTMLERQYVSSEGERKSMIIGDLMSFSQELGEYAIRNVLIVAGEGHTGDTMLIAKKSTIEAFPGANVKTCVFYNENVPRSIEYDYSSIVGEGYNMMPWQDRGSIRESYWSKCKIYIVRHCETEMNQCDRFIGSTNVPLSEEGKKHAEQLGEYFSTKKITRIYCSPMDRCVQTAKTILQKLGNNCAEKRVVIDENLREMDYGDWEGKSRDEIQYLYSKEYMKYQCDPNYRVPGSRDCPRKVRRRIERFIKQVVRFHESKRPFSSAIIVVTHKTAGRILINRMLADDKQNKEHYRDVDMDNGSVTTAYFEDGRFQQVKAEPCGNID